MIVLAGATSTSMKLHYSQPRCLSGSTIAHVPSACAALQLMSALVTRFGQGNLHTRTNMLQQTCNKTPRLLVRCRRALGWK